MKTLSKILLLTTFCILYSLFCLHAQNLVPNPSFEDTVACPENAGNTNSLYGWETNINTADYFNFCCKNPLQVAVPKNAWGYQCPANGNAYVGIYTYSQTNPGSNEYIGCHLQSSLLIGQKYYVSLKVSLADDNPNLMCGINNIGILFTNLLYSTQITIPAPVLNNFAHIATSNIVIDTAQWVTIRGSFLADSAYQYLLIGNFFDNSNVIINCLDSNNISNRWSYYYIDDICVSIDSMTCEIPNGINICDSLGIISNAYHENIKLFPIPIVDVLTINIFDSVRTRIKIYNYMGQLLLNNIFNEKVIQIDFSRFPSGMYIVQVQQNHYIFNKKVIVSRLN